MASRRGRTLPLALGWLRQHLVESSHGTNVRPASTLRARLPPLARLTATAAEATTAAAHRSGLRSERAALRSFAYRTSWPRLFTYRTSSDAGYVGQNWQAAVTGGVPGGSLPGSGLPHADRRGWLAAAGGMQSGSHACSNNAAVVAYKSS